MEHKDKISKTLWMLLIFSLFFPIRHVFHVESRFISETCSDFTSFSLYLSDLLILGLIGLNYQSIKISRGILVLFTWWILTIALIQDINGLNIYFFARLVELLLVYLLFKDQIKQRLLPLFVSLAGVESLLAISQFIMRKSLGLYRLGESHLGTSMYGVAKIVSHGTTYLRGYGTFPHPNLLAAFLVTAILFNLYILLTDKFPKYKILWWITLPLNIFGLFITFSRAGLAAALISLIIFFACLIYNHGLSKKIIQGGGVVAGAFAISILVLFPFLQGRITINDNAIKERAFYNSIGIKIIKAYPLFGVGLGTSVLHMEQFSPVKLETWELQPIHNYYLLAAAETGIVGALILVGFFLWHTFKLAKRLNIYRITLLSIFIGYLFLMLFDHYFYTLEQTQLLLWVILGLMAHEIYL